MNICNSVSEFLCFHVFYCFFKNDDQRKNNFLISHTLFELWLVEIFTTQVEIYHASTHFCS